MKKPVSIIDILDSHARTHPDRTAFTYMEFAGNEKAEETDLTYRELFDKARNIAGVLQKEIRKGEPAILLYPSGLDFVAAFFGCLYAGVVAVPAYPPLTAAMHERLKSIISDSRSGHILTSAAMLDILTAHLDLTSAYGQMRWLCTDSFAGIGSDPGGAGPDGDAMAFIQYTSGSTADPRGVCLTHGNLLHNLESIRQSFETDGQTKGVFWLPLYHDMGLIGGLLHTVYVGSGTAIFSPLDFLRRPFRWLKAISDRRVSVSGGPNFAYDLCVRKVTDDQLAGLDLGCWEVAANGAEPIRWETMSRFVEKFAPCGFRPSAFLPCYGLAEATLMVSGTPRKAAPTVRAFDRSALEKNAVVHAPLNQDGAVMRVGSGPVVGDSRVAIVNPDTRIRCKENEVGEIWVQGRSVAQGYYRRPEESQLLFSAYCADTGEGPFLRTGDLGFLFEGELFVTGRIKDLIIIRGKNYYPGDIERAIDGSHPGLNAGGNAVFSIDSGGEERLIVVQEIKRGHGQKDREEILRAIRDAIMADFKLKAHDIVLIRHGAILKTSSGKVRRLANRNSYLEGALEIL